jgi:hypothetical protein
MTSLLKKPAELLDRLSGVWPDFEFLPHARKKIPQNQQPLHRSEFVSSRATEARARDAQYAYNADVDMFLKVKSNISQELFTSLFNPILQRKDKSIRVLQAVTNI